MKYLLGLLFLLLLTACPSTESAGRGDRILSTGNVITVVPDGFTPSVTISVSGEGLSSPDQRCQGSSTQLVCPIGDILTPIQLIINGSYDSVCVRSEGVGNRLEVFCRVDF